MDHREKVRLAIEELKARKRGGGLPVAPPLYRLMLRLGLELPPPPFWGFGARLVYQGIPFGLMLGAASAAFHWIGAREPLSWLGVVVATCSYSLATAALMPRDPDLPPWRDYRPIPPGTFE